MYKVNQENQGSEFHDYQGNVFSNSGHQVNQEDQSCNGKILKRINKNTNREFQGRM